MATRNVAVRFTTEIDGFRRAMADTAAATVTPGFGEDVTGDVWGVCGCR